MIEKDEMTGRQPFVASALASALRESEQRFKILSETSLQGVLVHRAFTPLYANGAFRDLLGWPVHGEPATREALLQALDAETRADPVSAWDTMLALRSWRGRSTLIDASGEPRRVEMLGRVVDWDGAPAVAIAALEVTADERAQRELVVARQQAESAARAKRRFLTAASHEMRTPLHATLGRLQLLTASAIDPEAQKLARDALSSCRRLLHHIDDVLDAATLESGALPLAREAFSVGRVVDMALDIVRDATDLADARVLIQADRCLRFVGDEARVRRIVVALLEDTLGRNPPGAVRLRCAAEGDGLGISVRAPGLIGATPIPPQGRAMESLSVARALAEAMGGALVERNGTGPFELSIFLPLEQAVAANGPEAAPRGLDVLVVEDNFGNRALIELVLKSLGHQPHLAESGIEGVALAASRPFDLVLMDLSMPGIDGFEATRRMRALNCPWADMPIAALTASTAPDVQDAAADAGMDAFLQKPLEVAKLAELIALLTRPTSVGTTELDHVEQEYGQNESADQQQSGHHKPRAMGAVT